MARVKQEVEEVLSLFPIRRDERTVFEHWQSLVSTHGVQGKQAHDARLEAAMMRHGIKHLLSFNDEDFKRFSEIDVTHPRNVSSFPVVQ